MPGTGINCNLDKSEALASCGVRAATEALIDRAVRPLRQQPEL